MGLNKILTGKYASRGRSRIIDEYKEKYTSKKGDRFFVDGITYEIGQILQENDEMEIEISSKIPVDEISEKNKEKYFKSIKKELSRQEFPPYYIVMEDIVKKIGEREVKKRDYIRLKYRAKTNYFYDEKAILEESERIVREQDDETIPFIPEANSIPGKLVLAAIEEKFHIFVKDKMTRMIQANLEAKSQYAVAGAAK